MNLLFVAQSTLDATFIKQELAKEMPALYVEVSPDIQDAIRQLAIPGRYSAVLLDSGFHEGDALAAVKALRARDMAVAVVSLIQPADLNSGINVLAAGADDYVVKRPGFTATLAGVLQRACSQQGNFPKVELKAAPVRRDTAGATRVLLRNISDIGASAGNASPIDPNGDRGSGEAADAGSQGRKLEIRIRELEVQRDALLRAMRASGENQVHLNEEFSIARSQWEKERLDLNQRLRSAEEQRPILEGSLREAAANSQIIDELRAETRALNEQLAELTTQCQGLEMNFHSAQTSLAEQAAVLQYEKEQRSLEAEGFRNQLNLLEEQRKTLENSDERHIAELQGWKCRQEEAEQLQRLFDEERVRMQQALQDTEAQLADRNEELRAGREQWDLRRAEWKQRLETVEESCANIERAVLLQKAQREELTGRFSADLSASENARQELEQELHRADEERTQLQASLRAERARTGQQAEKLRTEQEQWESMRLILEQQRDALEARIVQLEATRDEAARGHRASLAEAEKSRRETEERAAALANELRLLINEHNQAIERHEVERTQWENAGHELEQQKAALEEEFRLAKQSLQKLVKEEEENRLRWDSALNELEQQRLDAGSAHALAREAADKYLLQLKKLRELPGASSGS